MADLGHEDDDPAAERNYSGCEIEVWEDGRGGGTFSAHVAEDEEGKEPGYFVL